MSAKFPTPPVSSSDQDAPSWNKALPELVEAHRCDASTHETPVRSRMEPVSCLVQVNDTSAPAAGAARRHDMNKMTPQKTQTDFVAVVLKTNLPWSLTHSPGRFRRAGRQGCRQPTNRRYCTLYDREARI